MKYYKIYLYIFCTAMLSLVMASCNSFLEEKPESERTNEQFWKTASDARAAVNGLFYNGPLRLNDTDVDGGWTPKATMWGGVMSGLFVDKRKDRTFTNASEGATFNIESFDATALKLWTELYKGSAQANFVLSNLPKMEGILDQNVIENYAAQAKFFRAYAYYYLVKEFGDVPYIDFAYEDLNNMFKERTPSAKIYQNLEADLLEIIDGGALPDKAYYSNGGHVTKPMAQTLLAQIYLQWAGAPLNGGDAYYTKAAEMAMAVVSGGQHELIQASGSSDDLNSAFNIIKTTRSSNEIIFPKEYEQTTYNIGNSYPCRSIGADAFQWGVFKPGGDVLYNAYLPSDVLIDSYETSDIRSHEKQFFFRNWSDTKADGTVENFVLNNIGNWAWFDAESLKIGKNGNYNMPVFRYAEVLLIAAEGLARTGKEGTGVGEAKYYLNQVRKRAGLSDATATGDDLVQAILTERFHELPLEFRIWDDIRRTRLYPEADGMNSGTLKWTPLETANIQNKPEGVVKKGAIPTYALLWPIPLSEMQANKALQGHQNPGWN